MNNCLIFIFHREKAWAIVYKTFGYTNHTVMPEALEKWPVDLLEVLLPRHLELIYLINFYFINKIKDKFAGDGAKLSRLSLVEESTPKKIRMANLVSSLFLVGYFIYCLIQNSAF